MSKEKYYCELKEAPCVFNRLVAEGKIEGGSCHCILKEEAEKKREAEAEDKWQQDVLQQMTTNTQKDQSKKEGTDS